MSVVVQAVHTPEAPSKPAEVGWRGEGGRSTHQTSHPSEVESRLSQSALSSFWDRIQGHRCCAGCRAYLVGPVRVSRSVSKLRAQRARPQPEGSDCYLMNLCGVWCSPARAP